MDHTNTNTNITFSLVLDNFRVRYIDKTDTDHLLTTIHKKFPIKVNWKEDYFLGMILEWDYKQVHSKRNVGLSMLGYVKKALIKFKHHFIKQEFAASPYKDPIYGRKVQYKEIIDIPTFTNIQNPLTTTYLQKIPILCTSN